MVAALTHRARTLELVRAALAALDDFRAKSPGEAAEVYALLAAHMRSAAPMAFATLPAVAEPAPVAAAELISTPLTTRAFYELSALDRAAPLGPGVNVYLHDEAGHDASVALNAEQAGRFHEDFARLLAKLAEAGR